MKIDWYKHIFDQELPDQSLALTCLSSISPVSVSLCCVYRLMHEWRGGSRDSRVSLIRSHTIGRGSGNTCLHHFIYKTRNKQWLNNYCLILSHISIIYIYTYMYQNGNKTSKIMEAKACCVQSYSTMKQYKNFTQAFTSYIWLALSFNHNMFYLCMPSWQKQVIIFCQPFFQCVICICFNDILPCTQ